MNLLDEYQNMCDIKKQELSYKVKMELINELCSIKGVDFYDFMRIPIIIGEIFDKYTIIDYKLYGHYKKIRNYKSLQSCFNDLELITDEEKCSIFIIDDYHIEVYGGSKYRSGNFCIKDL